MAPGHSSVFNLLNNLLRGMVFVSIRRVLNQVHLVQNSPFSYVNKYRGGTSDATTSSALIVPLFTMSVDDFSHSKTAIFGVQK